MPRRFLTAVLASAACLLAGPAAAHAATGPVDVAGPDVTGALQIASQHWGLTPCGAQTTVVWTPDDNPQLNAMATWRNPIDAWLQPLQNSDCVIALNPNTTWDWPKLCTVITHEVGHLLGHPHSTDPTDLMAPVYRAPIPECLGAEPEGTLTAAADASAAAAAAASNAARVAQEQEVLAADAAARAQAPAPAVPVVVSRPTVVPTVAASRTAAIVRSSSAAATTAPRLTKAQLLGRCLKKATHKGASRSSARSSCKRSVARARVRRAA